MDELGYVIYCPTLSVAGLRNMSSAVSMRGMLVGTMPAAESQLIIDRPFVLRHLRQGYGPEVLARTLAHDQARRQVEALSEELEVAAKLLQETGKADLFAAATRYAQIESELAGQGGLIKVSQKQRKKLDKEKEDLTDQFGDSLESVYAKIAKRDGIRSQIESCEGALLSQWEESFNWLQDKKFVSPDRNSEGKVQLTPRGLACAAFADGHPLITGTIISDGVLEYLSQGEVCAWLCIFLRESRVKEVEKASTPPEKYGENLAWAMDETYGLATRLGVELDHNLSLVMHDWCIHKDIKRIAMWIEPAMLGTFVKAVMRVVSYLDVTREVLLGLSMFEAHNKLDNFMDLLMGGLVTNESLYLRLADDPE